MYKIMYLAILTLAIILVFSSANTVMSASYKDGFPVTFTMYSVDYTIDYFTADRIEPTDVALTSYYTDTTRQTGSHVSYLPGAVIPETQGQYIHEAQAGAWYKVIDSNVGAASIEFRYFAYDLVTEERTHTFNGNTYQHQWVSGHYGEIREWKYGTAMPIEYQLGPNEILGFYAVFHTHGASGRFYMYEYYLDSSATPTHCDIWHEQGGEATRFYVKDHFPYDLDCYASGEEVTFNLITIDDTLTIDYFICNTVAPTSDQLNSYFTNTTQETGIHQSYRPGGVIPETRGQYIDSAQASAWYKVIATNSNAPSIEFRYFALDVVTGQRTQTFNISYEHQWVSGHIGELREWKYGSSMPINYPLGPNEILGFYAVFHTHGAEGIYYDYEYYIDSTLTPTYCDVWYAGGEPATTYFVQDFCTIVSNLDCIPSSSQLPFATQFTVCLTNLEDRTRRIAGQLNVALASGGQYSNWKAGWTNVAAEESFCTNWNQTIPNLGTLVGENVFTLIGEDVTPAPYNQSPHQPSGDTFTDTQSIIGVSP